MASDAKSNSPNGEFIYFGTFNILSENNAYFNYGICEKSFNDEDNIARYDVIKKLILDNEFGILFLQEAGPTFIKIIKESDISKKYHYIDNYHGNITLLNRVYFHTPNNISKEVSDILDAKLKEKFAKKNDNPTLLGGNMQKDGKNSVEKLKRIETKIKDISRQINRGYCIVKAKDKHNDEYILINLHIPKTVEVQLAKTINNYIKTLPKNVKIICAGDFNKNKGSGDDIIKKLNPIYKGDKSNDFTSFKLGECSVKPPEMSDIDFESGIKKQSEKMETYGFSPATATKDMKQKNRQKNTNRMIFMPRFDPNIRYSFIDRIYLSNNIKYDEKVIIPIHKFNIDKNGKYELIQDDDSFKNYGYPYCDPSEYKKDKTCNLKKYNEIFTEQLKSNKGFWPSDHALLRIQIQIGKPTIVLSTVGQQEVIKQTVKQPNVSQPTSIPTIVLGTVKNPVPIPTTVLKTIGHQEVIKSAISQQVPQSSAKQQVTNPLQDITNQNVNNGHEKPNVNNNQAKPKGYAEWLIEQFNSFLSKNPGFTYDEYQYKIFRQFIDVNYPNRKSNFVNEQNQLFKNKQYDIFLSEKWKLYNQTYPDHKLEFNIWKYNINNNPQYNTYYNNLFNEKIEKSNILNKNREMLEKSYEDNLRLIFNDKKSQYYNDFNSWQYNIYLSLQNESTTQTTQIKRLIGTYRDTKSDYLKIKNI